MNFKTASEIRDFLWENLDLAHRAITFHILDVDVPVYEGGIIDSAMDLYDSCALYDIGGEHPEEPELYVTDCTSYIMGDGEAEDADGADIDTLEEVASCADPCALAAFLRELDVLASLHSVYVDNPAFEEEEEWE